MCRTENFDFDSYSRDEVAVAAAAAVAVIVIDEAAAAAGVGAAVDGVDVVAAVWFVVVSHALAGVRRHFASAELGFVLQIDTVAVVVIAVEAAAAAVAAVDSVRCRTIDVFAIG